MLLTSALPVTLRLVRIDFAHALVSDFETSGDRGPSPSPCFGSQGKLGLVVFASSRTYSRLRIFLTESKFMRLDFENFHPCRMIPFVSNAVALNFTRTICAGGNYLK